MAAGDRRRVIAVGDRAAAAIPRQTAGVPAGTADGAVVGAAQQRAAAHLAHQAAKAAVAVIAGHRAVIGTVLYGAAALQLTRQAAHAVLAGHGIAVDAAHHGTAVHRTGNTAAGAGAAVAGRDLDRYGAVLHGGIGHIHRQSGGPAAGDLAEQGQIPDDRAAACDEQRHAAGGTCRHLGDGMARAVKGAVEAAGGADAAPQQRTGGAVVVAQTDVIPQADGLAGERVCLVVHQLRQSRQLPGGGDGKRRPAVAVPGGIRHLEPRFFRGLGHSCYHQRHVSSGNGEFRTQEVPFCFRTACAVLIGEDKVKFPAVHIVVVLGIHAVLDGGLYRQHVILIDGIAADHRRVRHTDGLTVHIGRAGLCDREGIDAALRQLYGTGYHRLHHGAQGHIRRNGIVVAQQLCAVGAVAAEHAARRHGVGEIDHRSLCHVAAGRGRYSDAHVDLTGTGGPAALPEQPWIAARAIHIRAAVGVQGGHQGLAPHLCRRPHTDVDGTGGAAAHIPAVGGGIVVAAGQGIAVGNGIGAAVVAADAPSPLVAAGIDGAHVIAGVDIQSLVVAADTADRTGVGAADASGIVAVDDVALAPARAHDAAHALAVGAADGGVVGAVLDAHAGADAAHTAHDAAHHTAATDTAVNGQVPHRRRLGRVALAVIRLAQIAHQADSLGIGVMLGAVPVAVQVGDAVSPTVQRAVEERLDRYGVIHIIGRHGVLAADGRPVDAVAAAHVHVAAQVHRFVGEIIVGAAVIDGACHIAAARAHQYYIVLPGGHQQRRVALDPPAGGLGAGASIDQRRQSRQLGRSGQGEFRLIRVVPGDVHRAVPSGGGEILHRHRALRHPLWQCVSVAILRLPKGDGLLCPGGIRIADGGHIIAAAALRRHFRPGGKGLRSIKGFRFSIFRRCFLRRQGSSFHILRCLVRLHGHRRSRQAQQQAQGQQRSQPSLLRMLHRYGSFLPSFSHTAAGI